MDPLRMGLPSALNARTLSKSWTTDDAIDVNEVPYLRGTVEREAPFQVNQTDLHAQSDHDLIALDIDRQGTQSPLGNCFARDRKTFMNNLPSLAADTTRVLLSDVGGSGTSHMWMEEHNKPQHNHPSRDNTVRRSPLSYGFLEAPSLIPKSHAKTYTFDFWDLQNLWTPTLLSRVRPFILQNNVLESLLRYSGSESGIGRYMGATRQRLFLGPRAIPFWECISSMESHYGEDGRLEIRCGFATLPLNFVASIAGQRSMAGPDLPVQDVSAGIWFSPLKYHFQKILTSESSATTICQASSIFACQTVVVDLLRAVIECWIVFVTETLLQTSPHVLEQDTRSRAYNTGVLNRMSRVSRDIGLLFNFTTDALLLTLKENDLVSRNKLLSIRIESHAKLQRLQHRIDDLTSNFNSTLEVKEMLVEESHTQSVKRLTLIAAIFLPLGLASSLLSMQTRVIDLGVLWYDYFGICFLLFFVGVHIYQAARGWDIIESIRVTQTAVFLDLFKNHISRRQYKVLRSIFASIVQPRFNGTKWLILRNLLHNGFFAALVLSFCVGMFKSLNLAWKIAAYSAAGWVAGLFLLCIAMFWVNVYDIKLFLTTRVADS